MNKHRVIKSILAAELVLLVPLVAMLFTNEVDWDIRDFLIVGVLLAGVGVASELIINGIQRNSKQAIIGIILAASMLLIWAELAVGIFGSPFAGS